MNVYDITFQSHGDDRGQLVSLEMGKEIPFEPKRVYYIYATKEGVRRGFHAHKRLEQVLVCVSGSCRLLLDDSHEKRIVELNSPVSGLYIGNDVWREMYDFSHDAVLLVIASEIYDEADYIRDYNEFLRYKENL